MLFALSMRQLPQATRGLSAISWQTRLSGSTSGRGSQPAKEEVALLSAFISQTLAERYSGGWSLQLRGRGLTDVIEHVLLPFVEAGASYAPSPIELKAEGEKVVWLGCVTTIDGPTGERKDSAFAHVWTVRDGLATNLRQFIYSTTATNGSVHRGSQQIPI